MATDAPITGALTCAPSNILHSLTVGDRDALNALEMRLNHVAATARLIGEHGDLDRDFAEAMRGIGETLDDLARRMQEITRPSSCAEGC